MKKECIFIKWENTILRLNNNQSDFCDKKYKKLLNFNLNFLIFTFKIDLKTQNC